MIRAKCRGPREGAFINLVPLTHLDRLGCKLLLKTVLGPMGPVEKDDCQKVPVLHTWKSTHSVTHRRRSIIERD